MCIFALCICFMYRTHGVRLGFVEGAKIITVLLEVRDVAGASVSEVPK